MSSHRANEWEVVVFMLGDQAFAINVNKTREILRWMGYRPVPETAPALVGITTVRGQALQLLDLRLFLGINSPVPIEETKVMIVEFNDVRLGFLVDSVERIYRINANDLDATLAGKYLGRWVLYVMKKDSRNVLLLDYEAIVQATAPSVAERNLDAEKLTVFKNKINDSDKFSILLADDSPLLRKQIEDALAMGGFDRVKLVRDGMEAYEALVERREKFNLLVTDIEMPRMDGITLLERIRNDTEIKDLPVILFSSITTEDIMSRVGNTKASGYVMKPDIYKLVEKVYEVYNSKIESAQ
ncbi:histidine kinase [Synergistales bacterium]|nr:histidine kinase [Synergistales bacterium]